MKAIAVRSVSSPSPKRMTLSPVPSAVRRTIGPAGSNKVTVTSQRIMARSDNGKSPLQRLLPKQNRKRRKRRSLSRSVRTAVPRIPVLRSSAPAAGKRSHSMSGANRQTAVSRSGLAASTMNMPPFICRPLILSAAYRRSRISSALRQRISLFPAAPIPLTIFPVFKRWRASIARPHLRPSGTGLPS